MNNLFKSNKLKGEDPANLMSNQMPKWKRSLISASLRSTRDKFLSQNHLIIVRAKSMDEVSAWSPFNLVRLLGAVVLSK